MRRTVGLLGVLLVWILVFGVPDRLWGAPQSKEGVASSAVYRDPKGFFTIVPPPGWKIEEYPRDPRGKVTFIGPERGVDLRVLVNMVDFESIDALVGFCAEAEARIGTDTHIRKVVACGRQAIRRTFQFRGLQMYVTDLILGRADHNLQYGALPDKYEKYLPVVVKSIETYRPLYHEFTDEELGAHFVAKKVRVVQAMVTSGRLHLALEELEEGLAAAPDNSELLRLKGEIEDQLKR